jgi:hypothetical protein
MSTSFFVAPYEPDSWESAPSDLRIDPEQYRRQMQQEWPEAAIQSPPPFPTYLLWWRLDGEGELGAEGGLQNDRQVVETRPYPEPSFLRFVLWHRKVVVREHRLFLFREDSPRSLELTSSTSADELRRFYQTS